MKRRRAMLLVIPILVAAVSGLAVAQYRGRFGGGGMQLPADRAGVPNWKNDERFKHDVFTFVRVEYNSGGGGCRWAAGAAGAEEAASAAEAVAGAAADGAAAGRPTGPTATSTSRSGSSSSPR